MGTFPTKSFLKHSTLPGLMAGGCFFWHSWRESKLSKEFVGICFVVVVKKI